MIVAHLRHLLPSAHFLPIPCLELGPGPVLTPTSVSSQILRPVTLTLTELLAISHSESLPMLWPTSAQFGTYSCPLTYQPRSHLPGFSTRRCQGKGVSYLLLSSHQRFVLLPPNSTNSQHCHAAQGVQALGFSYGNAACAATGQVAGPPVTRHRCGSVPLLPISM